MDPSGAPLTTGQQAALGAFSTLLGGVTAGLAGQNALAGAAAAQNEALNNAGKHPGVGGLLTVAGAIIGGVLAGGGSVPADVVTGGLNIAATPAEVAAGSAAGAALGNRIGALLNSNDSGGDTTASSDGDTNTNVPSLPTDLVGDQSDPRAGPNKSGTRVTSGPLTPENGGTGYYDKDLNTLTGGTRPWQPGDSAPPGNGIFGRPQNSSGGQSIDIPANGDKPHETLHY